MNSQYMREVLYIFPNEPFFEQKYTKELYVWIDKTLSFEGPVLKGAVMK